MLLAWRTNQQTRLAELVTPTVLSQLQTTSNVEPNWTYVSCEGTAGSTYCQFLNGDGDAIILRVENLSLGKANAATEVKLDLTTYSDNAVEYVKAFIEAWRNENTKRMAILADQSEVVYFTQYTPPGSYSTCATFTIGNTSVRVYNAEGAQLHADARGCLARRQTRDHGTLRHAGKLHLSRRTMRAWTMPRSSLVRAQARFARPTRWRA